jgi:hypothetical protein
MMLTNGTNQQPIVHPGVTPASVTPRAGRFFVAR